MADAPIKSEDQVHDEALTATQGLTGRLSAQLDELKTKQQDLI